jgi:diguanylate cyclase
MSIEIEPAPTAPSADAPRARLAALMRIADPQCGSAATDGEQAARIAELLAAELGEPTEALRAAAWRCAHLLRLGRNHELQAVAGAELPRMTAPELIDDRFELMRLLTLSAAESGAHGLGLETANRMVAEARDDRPGQAVIAAYALAVCLERTGDSWQALRVAERALAAAADDAPDAAVMILHNAVCAMSIGLFHHLNGVADRAELHTLLVSARSAGERALALQERLRNAFYVVATAGNLGEVLLHLGELETSAQLLDRALDAAIAQGALSYEWRVRTSLADWLLASGRPADAAAAIDRLIAAMGDSPPAQTAVRAHHAAYRAHRALGDPARALAHLERAEQQERRNLMAQLRSRSAHFVTRAEAERAESQAERDPLTGLGNRRHTDRRWAELMAVARLRATAGHDEPLALAQLDVDHFKHINDEHGHAVGDRVLVALAGLLRAQLRAGDAVARHGGEEFVLLLPGLDAEQAAEVCERLRERIANYPWRQALALAPEAPALAITVSVGIAEAPPHDLVLLLQRADDALYQAKRAGRNRVCRSRTDETGGSGR